MRVRVLDAGLLKYRRQRPLRNSNDGSARGLSVPEVVGAIRRSIPRQRECVQHHFEGLRNWEVHRLTALLGPEQRAPCLLCAVPGNGISAESSNVGNPQGAGAEKHDHGAGAKLFVSHSTPVVLATPNLAARRQNSVFFVGCIWHDLVRLEIARWPEVVCRTESDPFMANAISEKRAERLEFNFPGYRPDFARIPVILKIVQTYFGKRFQSTLLAERSEQSKRISVFSESAVLDIPAVTRLGIGRSTMIKEPLHGGADRALWILDYGLPGGAGCQASIDLPHHFIHQNIGALAISGFKRYAGALAPVVTIDVESAIAFIGTHITAAASVVRAFSDVPPECVQTSIVRHGVDITSECAESVS